MYFSGPIFMWALDKPFEIYSEGSLIIKFGDDDDDEAGFLRLSIMRNDR